MATRKPKNQPTEAPVAPPEPPGDTDLNLQIRHLWHAGREIEAVTAYRDAHGELERPGLSEAREFCEKLAAKGPPPSSYQPPAEPQPEPTIIEQVVHAADPAFLPTEPREEPVAVKVPIPSRYRLLKTVEIEHIFKLGPEELAAASMRLAVQVQELADIDAAHAGFRRKMKEEKAAAVGEHARTADIVRTGTEARTVKVEKIADHVDGIVRTIVKGGPLDGVCIGTEPIAEGDRQLSLFQAEQHAGDTVSDLLDRPAKEPEAEPEAEPEGDTDGEEADEEEDAEEDSEEDSDPDDF